MKLADAVPFVWNVRADGRIPADVAEAATLGLPIVAYVGPGARIDGWTAELLEECAEVRRYGV
ncbi:MAG TPA: hypothetical protein VGW10_19330 [Solirubrobacteraceae bacterium]|nr:hypothetical protein [Solirubrobacteraceae bacterium]